MATNNSVSSPLSPLQDINEQDKKAFEKIITCRRSVRGFTKQLIDDEQLQSIFSTAQMSPSNCNTQPWIAHVVSGKACDELRDAMVEATMKGQMGYDFPYDGKYEGELKVRQYDAAKQLYNAMGIKREDRAGRNQAFLRNYQLFGAPHVVFLFIHQDFGFREAADIGMYAQSLLLSMTANGIASCPQTALSFHANLVREKLEIEEEYKLLFGISFGYEDPDEPANNARVGRAPIEQTVTFHS